MVTHGYRDDEPFNMTWIREAKISPLMISRHNLALRVSLPTPPAASASEAAIAQLVPEGSDPFRYCTVKIRAQWSDLVLMKLFRATPDGC